MKSAPTLESTIEVVEFRLAQERYAIESRYIQEVQPLRDLTLLPCTPAFIVGIVNVRSRILPVFDLKKLLDLPSQGLTDLHSVILVRRNDCEVGILADVVVGVRTIPVNHLQSSLATLTGMRHEFLRGVTAEAVIVLNLERILSDPRIIVDEEVEA